MYRHYKVRQPLREFYLNVYIMYITNINFLRISSLRMEYILNKSRDIKVKKLIVFTILKIKHKKAKNKNVIFPSASFGRLTPTNS